MSTNRKGVHYLYVKCNVDSNNFLSMYNGMRSKIAVKGFFQGEAFFIEALLIYCGRRTDMRKHTSTGALLAEIFQNCGSF